MTRSLLLLVLLVAGLGCEANSVGAREAGALGGAALGAGLGAIVGNQSGRAGEGVAIGAAIGALSGALVGNQLDATNRRLDRQEQQIYSQQNQLDENRRILEELRNRGADVRESDRGVVINLPDVLFESGSSALTPEAYRATAEIAEVLKGIAGRRVSVEGHTDSVGTIAFNQRLSEERARAVSQQLTDRGVGKSQVATVGFGETDPVASNLSEAGRRRNRRVEVVVENRGADAGFAQ